MTRLAWLVFAALLLPALPAEGFSTRLSVNGRAAVTQRTAPAVRNVLIVMVDTLRADRLRAYDPDARVDSPAFDRLVRGGQLFERAYAPASWTKPSAASVLTGLLPSHHGATTHNRVLDPRVPTLAERLSLAGYQTAAFVANGYVSERFGFERGFDEFRNAATNGRASGDELVEDLLAWLDAHHDSAPFFVYLHPTDVHAPYRPRPSTLRTLTDGLYHGPIDFDASPNLLRSIERGELTLTDRDRSRLLALYDAGVADHDELVLDPLVEGLAERGLMDDTLIVFVSDHGEELFDHGSVGHGGARVWQELIHVPLVMHWPGLAPARVHGTVGLVSIAATITDAVGLPVDPTLDGQSLVPLLEGQSPATAPVVGETGGLVFVVANRFKLVRSAGSADGWVDLLSDPREIESAADIGRKAVAHFGAALSRLTPREDRGGVEIDADTLRRLTALGYVD
jgi:arylsulfatase A-like enzyme